jgi:outer membrane protein TolC
MAVSPREPNAALPANIDGAPVESLSARAVAADPALQQLQAQISAQAARARASAALRRPALTLGAGYQIDRAVRSGAIFGAPVVTSGIAIPIFDRGTISGAVREAEATRSVLEAQAQGRTRQVQAEVASAAADIAASSARFQFAQGARVQAEEGLRIALFGFRQGALGSLDVLSAKNAAASARGEERQAADDLASARARLRIILGVSTTS